MNSIASEQQELARAKVQAAKLAAQLHSIVSAAKPKGCGKTSCMACEFNQKTLDDSYQSMLIATLGIWDN